MIVTPQDVARELFRNSGSFVGVIVHAWQKADTENKSRLYEAFPEIVQTIHEWYTSPNERDFFRKYGIVNE